MSCTWEIAKTWEFEKVQAEILRTKKGRPMGSALFLSAGMKILDYLAVLEMFRAGFINTYT
jgi:hypothetical protein